MREREYLSEKGGKGKRDEEKDGDGKRVGGTRDLFVMQSFSTFLNT